MPPFGLKGQLLLSLCCNRLRSLVSAQFDRWNFLPSRNGVNVWLTEPELPSCLSILAKLCHLGFLSQ